MKTKKNGRNFFPILLAVLTLTLGGCTKPNPYAGDERYQIYLKATATGFEGTYEEWLESIKGDDGKDGIDGKDGATPYIGENGNWWIGEHDTGFSASGPKGDTGSSGESGPKGDKGDQGENGHDGHDGKDGNDGADHPHAGETFTVNYHLNGGTMPSGVISTLIVNWGDTLDLPTPTKQGFYFAGWFTGETINDSQFYRKDGVFRNMDLFAHWETGKYTIVWMNYDGVILENDYDVIYGTTPTFDGPTPLKSYDSEFQYSFSGWSPEIVPVNGPQTYTAQYEKIVNSYTITWNIEGSISSESYKYGDTPSYKNGTPTKIDSDQYVYNFSGWSPAIGSVTSDVTYTAQFDNTIKSYSISWKNYDGSVLNTSQYEYGQFPYFDGIPSREDDAEYTYSFVGWSPSLTLVTGDATYTAQYEQNEATIFEIKFNLNGGTGSIPSQIKNKGTAINLTNQIPTFDSHVFIGWNNIYENKIYQPGDSFLLDYNLSLSALWGHECGHCENTGKETITHQCGICWGSGKKCNNCGSRSVKQVVGNGYSYYQCNSCNSTSIGSCSTCGGKGTTSSLETCRVCEGLKYEIGLAPTISSIEARKIQLTCIPGYEYSINGIDWQKSCLFEGLKPSTTYNFYQRRATDGDIPFGITSKKLTTTTNSTTSFYIAYNLNGGSNTGSNPATYSSNGSSIMLANPYRENYDFAGWKYNGSLVTSINPSWKVDIVLEATWNATAYSISFNLNGGSGVNPTTHGIETSEIVLNQPTKKGYEFTGWTGSNGSTPELVVTIPENSIGTLSYNANWRIVQYQITYDLNGGVNNIDNPLSYNVEDSNMTLKEPSKPNYDFTGWTSNGNKTTILRTSDAENKSFTATWTPTNYLITYNLGGGFSSNPINHNIESADITLTDPTKDGYTFTGWTGSNGDIPESTIIIPEGNVEELTYTANWSLNTYSITYHLDGGVNHIKNPNAYTIEDTVTLSDATKQYYTFDGWYSDSNFTSKVTTLKGQFGDLNLYAKFIPYSYNSSFNTNGGRIEFKIYPDFCDGSTPVAVSIKSGESFNPYLLTIPKRSGFIFGGWYLDSNYENLVTSDYLIRSNTTLYAKWISVSHSYNPLSGFISVYGYGQSSANGGNHAATSYFYVPYTSTGKVTLTCSLENSGIASLSSSANAYLEDTTTGKKIYSKSSSSVFSETITLSLIQGHTYKIYAYGTYTSKAGLQPINWHRGTAQLKIQSEGNVSTPLECNSSFIQNYESTTIKPISSSRDGYDFTGWYDTDGNLISETWTYSGDQTFYAGWELHDYSLDYMLNGGFNNPNNPASYTLNDVINLEPPTRNGYTFNGWYTDSSFTKPITVINGTDYCDYKLYAKWTANSYIATLDYDGGQNCATITFVSNGLTIKMVDLYKDSTLQYFIPENKPGGNYVFAGWYKDIDYKNLFVFDGVIDSDITLYAKWIDVEGYSTSQLGNTVSTSINGLEYQYIALVSPITQTITVTSDSGLDLYGAIYDFNWNQVYFNDDISDSNLDFSMVYTLEAGELYYIAYKANQASTSGIATIIIGGNQISTTSIIGEYSQIIDTVSVIYDGSYTLPTPKKQGYVFIGWYDENGSPVDDSSWIYSENVVIYAHWELI